MARSWTGSKIRILQEDDYDEQIDSLLNCTTNLMCCSVEATGVASILNYIMFAMKPFLCWLTHPARQHCSKVVQADAVVFSVSCQFLVWP